MQLIARKRYRIYWPEDLPVTVGSAKRHRHLGRDMLVFVRELAIAGRFGDLGTGGLDKIEDGLEKAGLAGKVTAGDDHSAAAMSFALVIERELDFGADSKRPLGKQTDPLGRPLDVLAHEINRVRKTHRYAFTVFSLWFCSDCHCYFI